MKMHEQFQPVQLSAEDAAAALAERQRNPAAGSELLRGVRANIVQSIRAFHADELQQAAAASGQHFLYVNLADTQTKQEVLETTGANFMLPAHFGRNFDALYDCLTDPLHKAGAQPGFIVVVEKIPCTAKFDREARELLLDVFRDAADYWADRNVPFRCFYSFAASALQTSGSRSKKGSRRRSKARTKVEVEKTVVLDGMVEVSQTALRMSSPFNAGYGGAA
mgnify:CR=1 FL=1